MKPTIITLIMSLFLSLGLFAQDKQIVDDIYFKPSDAKALIKERKNKTVTRPNVKNGVRVIVFSDQLEDSTDLDADTLAMRPEPLDSTEDAGYYVNGFNGTESDLEYANRIRKFHNPKYTIFIGDPAYNDIYFLNSWDWNVYVDGSYAWVTPTWTNPYWFDYMYSPYSYSSWYWRRNLYSP